MQSERSYIHIYISGIKYGLQTLFNVSSPFHCLNFQQQLQLTKLSTTTDTKHNNRCRTPNTKRWKWSLPTCSSVRAASVALCQAEPFECVLAWLWMTRSSCGPQCSDTECRHSEPANGTHRRLFHSMLTCLSPALPQPLPQPKLHFYVNIYATWTQHRLLMNNLRHY